LKSYLSTLPRLIAALAFAASTTAAVVLNGAATAGSAPAAPFSAAPQAADAAVFVGVGFGQRYPRWRWDGFHRSWIRFGVGFGSPGFVANVGYVGYAPPPGPPFWVRPAFFGPRPFFFPRRAFFRPVFFDGGFHRGFDRGFDRGFHRGFDRGFNRGFRR
jgi:hypothetical protein